MARANRGLRATTLLLVVVALALAAHAVAAGGGALPDTVPVPLVVLGLPLLPLCWWAADRGAGAVARVAVAAGVGQLLVHLSLVIEPTAAHGSGHAAPPLAHPVSHSSADPHHLGMALAHLAACLAVALGWWLGQAMLRRVGRWWSTVRPQLARPAHHAGAPVGRVPSLLRRLAEATAPIRGPPTRTCPT